MATIRGEADLALLEPGVYVGRHPDTGVLHRLTIRSSTITIERKPYVSDNPDHWTQEYKTIIDEAENHLWLILKIKQNPDVWDAHERFIRKPTNRPNPRAHQGKTPA